jgi:S-adenosylmethionine/arginine decarboxylase-like enzyme
MKKSIPLIKQFVALIEIEKIDDSLESVEKLAKNIVLDLNLKIVKKVFYIFKPQGITFGYILSQSHLMISTYPENKKIHIDLVMCVDRKKTDFKNSLTDRLSKYQITSLKIKAINF